MYKVALALLLLSWLQPSHFPPWMSWHSEVLAFLAALTLVVHIAWASKESAEEGAIPISAAAVPLFALVAVVWVQWSCGLLVFLGDAVVLTGYLALSLASLVAGFNVGNRNSKNVELLAGALLTGAILSATVAFVQVTGVWESSSLINRMQFLGRPGANLGQPNQLATLLLMGLSSLLYLYEKKRLGAYSATLVSLVLATGLAATASRTAVISLFVLAGWWFAKRLKIASGLRTWWLLSLLAGVLLFYWAWPRAVDLLMQMTPSTSVVNTVAYNRWFVWPQLVDAILLRPWFGWGIGQVSTAHNAVIDGYSISEPYTYAHNVLLDFALGTGLPLTLLFLATICLWLWRRVLHIRELTPWYSVAVVIPFAIHSLLEFPFAYAYFLLPVMFALGVLESSVGSKPLFHFQKMRVAFVTCVAAVVFIWTIFEYIAIEEDFRVVRFESQRVGQTQAGYSKPDLTLLTQLDAVLSAGRVLPRPNMPREEIELVKVVALHYPWLATQNRYALSLALNNNEVEAIRQLKVIKAQRGAKTYAKIKDAWRALAEEKFPQLLTFEMP